MADTTTSNAVGRVRVIDNTRLFNRYLESLAQRTTVRLPDGIPMFPASPDGGFLDIATALTNLSLLLRASVIKSAEVATGASTVAQVIWAGPGGKITSIFVKTTNTQPITLYDNASAASGNPLYVVAGGVATNTYIPVQIAVTNGITAGKVLNSPNIIVNYCEV